MANPAAPDRQEAYIVRTGASEHRGALGSDGSSARKRARNSEYNGSSCETPGVEKEAVSWAGVVADSVQSGLATSLIPQGWLDIFQGDSFSSKRVCIRRD